MQARGRETTAGKETVKCAAAVVAAELCFCRKEDLYDEFAIIIKRRFLFDGQPHALLLALHQVTVSHEQSSGTSRELDSCCMPGQMECRVCYPRVRGSIPDVGFIVLLGQQSIIGHGCWQGEYRLAGAGLKMTTEFHPTASA